MNKILKLWKISSILILALILLIMSSMSVIAENDSSEDVYFFTGAATSNNWEFYGKRDAIDITEISKSVSGSDITVSLNVKGSIADNEKIYYYIFLEKDATSNYVVHYSQNSGRATKNGDLVEYEDVEPDFTISANRKTISYTFSNINTSIDYKLWGYAIEQVNPKDITSGAWYDYNPDTKAPYSSVVDEDNSDTTKPNGTPGFEIITLIAAIGIALIILKRKK